MIFLSGAAGFAFGCLLVALLPIPSAAVGFLGFLAVLFCFVFLVTKRRLYLAACIALLACTVAVARTHALSTDAPPELAERLGSRVTVEGTVVADPDIRERHQRLIVETRNTRVLAIVPLFPDVSLGQKIRVYGELERPEPFDTESGRVFRYDRFLAKDGVFLTLSYASFDIAGEREGDWFAVRGALSDLKRGLLDMLAHALPEPHASLAGGLVAGGKQGLGDRLLEAFIQSGLVHIVVLSGYNVMIVAEAVMRALSFLPRHYALTSAAGTIGAFVLAAGAGAASIRAGLMAGIGVFARATYRTYDAARALMFAGVLMLLWNPLLLAYDPGFQLSFLATLGLIFGAPIVDRYLKFIKSDFLREIAAATVAAQLAVLPLLLYQNGLLSLVALPANLLVLPLVPLAMVLSALAGLLAWLVPPFAAFFGLPAYAVLSYIIAVAEFSTSVPFAAVTVPIFPFALVIAAYALLALLILRYRTALPAHSS